jgi:hypothetical protein
MTYESTDAFFGEEHSDDEHKLQIEHTPEQLFQSMQ